MAFVPNVKRKRNDMLDVFIDALVDSLKVLAVVFLFNVLISFVENYISEKIEKDKKFSPLLGAAFGLVPQCGFSIVASDLYIKRHITMGTLIAVFIACSDEAIPLILAEPSKALMVLPLIGIKFVLGFIVGYLVDFIIVKLSKNKVVRETEIQVDNSNKNESHVGCCHHHIEGENESQLKNHLIHPLLHSLKIFGYVFVINMLFGIIIYYVGEENISAFLLNNKYLAPLYTTIIGLIPNCASSVIITKLYVLDKLSFGACMAGLIVNAGLGFMVLLKNKKMIKKTMIILSILVTVSLIFGYSCCLIFGF